MKSIATNSTSDVPNPSLLVGGAGCKVENVYRSLWVCVPLIKIREACVKKFEVLVKRSLHFVCLLHATCKRHATVKF
jgi:hypothetical protein